MRIIFAALFVGTVGCLSLNSSAARAAAETVVYSFCSQEGCADGYLPQASLIAIDGMLYGTTAEGAGGANCGSVGCGTVFSLDPGTGAQTVIHSFCRQQNCPDGAGPSAALINLNGKLFGTTVSGGAYKYFGTAFSLNRITGKLKVLHSFGTGADIGSPYASLIKFEGELYGTTGGGGGGTVFAIDPKAREETALFLDIGNSAAALIDVNRTLYGTTYDGGAYGLGSVFALDPGTGKETVVYSFCSQQNCPDGLQPFAGLINSHGTLYGTTASGGASGYGTIFSIDLATGTETVLYSFCGQQGCTDGASPRTSLIDVNGTLYGTTMSGGSNNTGTAFAFDLASGVENVIYSFCGQQNCTDGKYPASSLFYSNGLLYGTTGSGGAGAYCPYAGGCGTVFALKP